MHCIQEMSSIVSFTRPTCVVFTGLCPVLFSRWRPQERLQLLLRQSRHQLARVVSVVARVFRCSDAMELLSSSKQLLACCFQARSSRSLRNHILYVAPFAELLFRRAPRCVCVGADESQEAIARVESTGSGEGEEDEGEVEATGATASTASKKKKNKKKHK